MKIRNIGPIQLRCVEALADELDHDGDPDHIWLIESGRWGVRVSIRPETLEGELRSLGHLSRALLSVDGLHARSAHALGNRIEREVLGMIMIVGHLNPRAGIEALQEWRDERLAVAA